MTTTIRARIVDDELVHAEMAFAVLSADSAELSWLREGSVSMLALDLAQWTDLSVVSYERTLDLLRDADLDSAARIGLADARRLARLAGAGAIVELRTGIDPGRVFAAVGNLAGVRGKPDVHVHIAGVVERDVLLGVAAANRKSHGRPWNC